MALSLTADTHEVNHGSGSSLDLGTTAGGNTFTILAWVRPTGTITSGSVIWDKSNAGFSVEKFFLWNGSGFLRTELGRATAYAVAQANNLALSNGVWSFVGLTWDGAAAPKLYVGSLTVPIAEVGYSTSTAGSGAIQDDAANDVRIGKAAGFGSNDSRSIAHVSQRNRILTLGEMIEQQFRRRNNSGCVLFVEHGWNGTGTQPDWSGNVNNGTVTGAAVADHVPIAPFTVSPGWQGAFAASTNATVNAGVVGLAGSLPVPALSAGATLNAGLLGIVGSLPSGAISGAAQASPGVVGIAGSIPAAAIAGSSDVAPAALAGTFSIPAGTISGGASVAPAAVIGVFSLPAPTVDVGGNATISADFVGVAGSLPAPALATDQTITPGVLAGTASIPAATIAGSASLSTGVLGVLAAIPGATVSAGASPGLATVGFTGTIQAATASGAATFPSGVLAGLFSIPAAAASTPGALLAAAPGRTFVVPDGGQGFVVPDSGDTFAVPSTRGGSFIV